MDLYQGSWKILTEETTGFDEFMDAIGVPEQAREVLKNLVYVVEYTKHGDSWTAKVEVVGSNEPEVYSWTPGVEFEYEGLDGMKMKSTFRWDGSACQEEHASVTGKWTSVRTVEGDSMTLTSESKGKSMVQKFKRV
ncbi:fatty acid-binding protein 2, liver-like [Haliotis cracherodii]|uniref:fatty acid-binding protein 2, liver-like n=1 Tax=Haliotis cracherodii TaxID=6455 RepID=UPI0039EC6AC9